MLKSLFFKQKSSTNELLPPPPPFPSLELQETEEQPVEIKKENMPVSEGLSDDLFSELDVKSARKEKIELTKEPGFGNDLLDDLFKDAIAETKPSSKLRKGAKKASKLKKGKLTKQIDRNILEDFGIESIKPEKIESIADFEFPENLESIEHLDIDSEMEEFKQNPELNISPNAEQEIMEAIGEVKHNKKSGLLDTLKQKLALTRQKRTKAEAKVYEIDQQQKVEIAYGLENVQSRIKNVRIALMDFNLARARDLYIEIMNIYNHLKPEEQAKVYNDIRDIYFERKSAEQLKA